MVEHSYKGLSYEILNVPEWSENRMTLKVIDMFIGTLRRKSTTPFADSEKLNFGRRRRFLTTHR